MTSPPGPPSTEADLFGEDLVAAYAALVARWRGGDRGAKVSLDLAKTLNRLGAVAPAVRALREVGRRGDLSPRERREFHGLRASMHKNVALGLERGPLRERHERRALAQYARAAAADGDTWPLVNLATLHRLRGDVARAEAYATRTLRALDDRLADRSGADDGWAEATRAEALLVLGRLDASAEAFRRAPFARERRFADRAATRRQARLLLRAAGLDAPAAEAWLARALPGPRVGMATGHMLDRAGRAHPRFPAAHAEAVGAAMDRWVADTGVEFGIASAACGTDILFHEAVRRTGARSRVVLPYPTEAFVATSVAHGGEAWVARLRVILGAGAEWASLASLQPVGRQTGWFEYGNEYMEGLALCKADEIESPIHRLAVWDGSPGDGPGGTAATVRRWRARRLAFDVIDPRHPERGARADRSSDGGPVPVEAVAPDVIGLLTADARGFSRLDDDQLETFTDVFLARIHDVIERGRRERGDEPFEVNTWGDGLLVAYDDLGALARCAFDLRDRVAREAWERFGLPRTLSLRIALHAGPVRRITNPVTGRPGLLGSHVSHGARLEPVTPAGSIFATEGFAALQRLRCPDAAVCTFVGKVPWAKRYGDDVGGLPTYRVERAPAS